MKAASSMFTLLAAGLLGCSAEIEATGRAVHGMDWPAAVAFSACVLGGAYVLGKFLS